MTLAPAPVSGLRPAANLALPPGILDAFRAAAGELGMASAAWLFVREVAAEAGPEGIDALRDALGRSFAVLDGIAAAWLVGALQEPEVNPAAVVRALGSVERVLVVGIEADFLDTLVPALEGRRVALLKSSSFDVDWDRLAANYLGRIELVELDDFQKWAGAKSALLTFAYGTVEESTHVLPLWLRVCGEDVRTQFHSLVAWDVMQAPMFLYPRWLVPAHASAFTELVRAK